MEVVFVAICGGRDYSDWRAMRRKIAELKVRFGPDLVIVHGDARGADSMAETVATQLELHTARVKALWNSSLGKAAGPVRNRIMAAFPLKLLVAFPGGVGTEHMKRTARAHNIPVEEVTDA